ncbi:MAG TPA: molybdopterin converting factor subunit 1 [Accumulibacter sp.]|nr:molybdopterin converting factor subunit 1 [Accumulibacter sp.]HMW18851.1 molybdopterin converting factor subunit 1 [Accumulibacter sp.]HMY07426.1 molybdopterin converting factor subunit 1 [Accumulibacter sp.]HNC19173.1 molybdopterin converting factor subunit 1 [Accumulibacter sp.]HND81279.1 molybdopterin converting factor subunit 1 [Accumulibacter sp.]
MLKILYFAHLREALDRASEDLPLPAGVTDVAALRGHLAERGGPWNLLLTARNLRCAINQEMARADSTIADGDEVAFFPPVTGG